MKKLSATVLQLEGQQEHYGKVFPVAYGFSSEEQDIGKATAWASDQSDAINSQTAEHGAVLLRGLPLSMAEDFDAMVEAFGLPGFSYEEALSNA